MVKEKILETGTADAFLYEEDSRLVIEFTNDCGNILNGGENKDISLRIKNILDKRSHVRNVLLDMGKCEFFLSTETADSGFADIMKDFYRMKARHYAVIIPSNLFRQMSLQANRLSVGNNPDTQFFRSRGEAEKWLDQFL